MSFAPAVLAPRRVVGSRFGLPQALLGRGNAARAASSGIREGRRRLVRVSAKGDTLLRSMSQNQEVVVLAVDGTQLVNEINFRGSGPLNGILVLADSNGYARGRVGNSKVDLPLRLDGKLNVGGAVGPGQPQPYTGITEIFNGEIAEDLVRYMVDSEQTNSALALGVRVQPDLAIANAGGFLVQVLPFASEETLTALEQNLSGLDSVTDLMASGLSPADITDRILHGIGRHPDISAQLTPRYGPCELGDLKQRMKRAVAALGRGEVNAILAEEGKLEMTCDFCNTTMTFTDDDIHEVLQQAS